MQIKEGLKFMIRHKNGSVGVIEQKHPAIEHWYGTFYYGLTKRGEPWTATATITSPSQIAAIDEKLFNEYIQLPAFSEEQKMVRDKILSIVQI